MNNGIAPSATPAQNTDTYPQLDEDSGSSPTRLCIVVGGDPAYDFAVLHQLPIKTYCGQWLHLDNVDDADGVNGETVNCAMCDLAVTL